MKLHVLLVLTLSAPSIALGAYQVDWSICEQKSKCERCIENGSISITSVDEKFFISGYSPHGSQVTGELKNCNKGALERWSCDEGRIRVEGDSKNVKVFYRGRPLSVNGKSFEFCSTQRKQ
jgi:hypothetical protein